MNGWFLSETGSIVSENGNFLPTYIVLQTLNFTKGPKQCFALNKKAHYIAAKLTY